MLQRMLNRLRGANDDEKGFTLIELLVVILIIGILAAIALPTFLGQSDKAKDASAKSDVRNAVTQMESCLVDDQMATCKDNSAVTQEGVTVSEAATNDTYTLTKLSTSKNGTDFNITKDSSSAPGAYTRTCGVTVTASKGTGSCPTSGEW